MTSRHTSCLNQGCLADPGRRVGTRFPDWHNLPKPRWRDILRALAGPAQRMHRYRNLRAATFYEAECDYHCRKHR